MNHMEGGWPKDVDPTEKDQTARYRKKVPPPCNPLATFCPPPETHPCHPPAPLLLQPTKTRTQNNSAGPQTKLRTGHALASWHSRHTQAVRPDPVPPQQCQQKPAAGRLFCLRFAADQRRSGGCLSARDDGGCPPPHFPPLRRLAACVGWPTTCRPPAQQRHRRLTPGSSVLLAARRLVQVEPAGCSGGRRHRTVAVNGRRGDAAIHYR